MPAGLDVLLRPRVLTRLEPFGRHAGGRHGVLPALALPPPASQRMVHRIHGDATVVRLSAHPSRGARLAELAVFVRRVGHHTNGGGANGAHRALLSGRQLHQRVPVLALLQQHRARARRPHHLRPLPGPELDVVDGGARGDVLQHQSVARLHRRPRPRGHLQTGCHFLRRQDVFVDPLPLCLRVRLRPRILHQRNACAAVGVVLDALHLPKHAVRQSAPLKVNEAV
mmetsp:Transcript_24466/g.43541  ORF Transcript_24466/g.43541 Transcript_24466/m.43541 type:complete len:226 (+) Transcript_24466:191-868(+)